MSLKSAPCRNRTYNLHVQSADVVTPSRRNRRVNGPLARVSARHDGLSDTQNVTKSQSAVQSGSEVRCAVKRGGAR